MDPATGHLVFATGADVARRRRIGPPLLRALTEGREAASTKAVTTASTPELPLQAFMRQRPGARLGRKPSVASDLLSIRDEHLGRGADFPATRGKHRPAHSVGTIEKQKPAWGLAALLAEPAP